MNIINFKEFNNSETLKESICEVLNKVRNFDDLRLRIVFQLLMNDISKTIKIKELDEYYDPMYNYWEILWGPNEASFLKPEDKNSYFIHIKNSHKHRFIIKVISVVDFITKNNNNIEVDEWLLKNKKDIESKDNCIIL